MKRALVAITLTIVLIFGLASPASASSSITTSEYVISPYGYAAWCGIVVSRQFLRDVNQSTMVTSWSTDSWSYLTPNNCSSSLMVTYAGAWITVVDVQSLSIYGWLTVPSCHQVRSGYSSIGDAFDAGWCDVPAYGSIRCSKLVVQVAWDNLDGLVHPKYILGTGIACVA